MRVTVVGASGFLGSHISNALKLHSVHKLQCVTRRPIKSPDLDTFRVAELTKSEGWAEILKDQDVVVLVAGYPSVPTNSSDDQLKNFFDVNVEGVSKLAKQAFSAGVKRFIFMSSIKVNGETTSHGSAFQAHDPPNPVDFYGISKAQAEENLFRIGFDTGMEIVIVRSPLVYGFGVKGNLMLIKKLIETGIPLPFASVRNKRSLVSVENLVDLIINCIDNPQAKNKVFLVSDGFDLSTPELIECIAEAIAKPSRLIRFPQSALAFGFKLAGQNMLAEKLLGSLQVDISKTTQILGWLPPLSVKEGILRCFPTSSC